MIKKKFKIKIITLFPEFITDYTKFGIIQRAIKQKLVEISPIFLRNFGVEERQTVDDRPYGGGVGMVLRPDVVFRAIGHARKGLKEKETRVILLTPQGKRFDQVNARRLAKYKNLVFVCGRYEGFDERVRQFVDEELSIGDYVLMGGELPALVASEAVLRLIPGVVGKLESTEKESFSENMLEYPQYTKPDVWEVKIKNKDKKTIVKKLKVPSVLKTGNHAKVDEWRRLEAEKRTKKRRPDLLG